ncbi:MAG: hypothetical protein JSV92_01075 [archaeon]|nr:MAG: hypothetical protein JSV92_01075 [archaeon]
MGTWTTYMMIMLAFLVIVLFIGLTLSPIAGELGGKVSYVHAFAVTNRIVSLVNMMSASPQNESAVIIIQPVNCNITFYNETSVYQDLNDNETLINAIYVESKMEWVKSSKSGLFFFSGDTKIVAFNKTIIASRALPTVIPIKKINGVIWIGVNNSS